MTTRLTPAPCADSARASVVYVLPAKIGGVLSVVQSLLCYRSGDDWDQHVVLTRNRLDRDTPFDGELLDATTQTRVDYSLPIENLHAVIRRLARAVPAGPGVIVASDLIDLAMLSMNDLGRAVVLILHGDSDYYYDLAARHDSAVHAFITASRRMNTRLAERLPRRVESIHWLPYGVPPAAWTRRGCTGPLRLVFAGRLEADKGIFDLPAIDAALAAGGVAVQWTIVGSGPDDGRLRDAWPSSDRVRYLGPKTSIDTHVELAKHDVIVLPTRHEGFPVTLLEAMAAGLVPVVSAVESGVPDIVEHGVTGLMPPVGNVASFVAAISLLAGNRSRLEQMSSAALSSVRDRFDARVRFGAYHALFARYSELYRPLAPSATLQYGSRLDRPWIPNALVRLVRSAIRGNRPVRT